MKWNKRHITGFVLLNVYADYLSLIVTNTLSSIWYSVTTFSNWFYRMSSIINVVFQLFTQPVKSVHLSHSKHYKVNNFYWITSFASKLPSLYYPIPPFPLRAEGKSLYSPIPPLPAQAEGESLYYPILPLSVRAEVESLYYPIPLLTVRAEGEWLYYPIPPLPVQTEGKKECWIPNLWISSHWSLTIL